MVFPEDLKGQLKSYIADRCGLYFRDHDLRNLEAGVTQRMKTCGFDSPHAYYIHLTTSEEKEGEFRELLNLLTINHTYFFRNEPQFMAFKEKTLEVLIERKMQEALTVSGVVRPSLRIWSAGCSTGEEPYAIAMILCETIPHPEDWDIEILATDASSDVLDKARQGIYGGNSMRLVEEPYRSKYFTKEILPGKGPKWKIADEIKGMVRFGFLNLVAEPYPADLDVIFCRNVTIYFELKTTIGIMDRFFGSLADPGYLFLGYSESLQFLTNKFRMESWKDGIYYQKATGKPGESSLAFSQEPGSQEIEVPDRAWPPPASEPTPEKTTPAALSSEEFEATRQQILRFIYLKEYARAMDLIEKVSAEGDRMADIHYLAADIDANCNRHEKAKARLRKALAIDPLFAPAYYLLGCMELEEGRTPSSKEHLGRALYIDKDFVMARFYMAHVFRTEGRKSDAIREYRNTLAVLSKGIPEGRNRMILQSSGFSPETLKSVCCDNLERLKMES